MTFDPIGYWQQHGPTDKPAHPAQEAALLDILHDLRPDSTLEVGCGEGRISRFLPKPLTVLDLDPDRVGRTSERVGATGIVSSLQDFTTDQRWDLVVAVEVLMHIPPSDIEAACHKLRTLSSRWVVTCDWTQSARTRRAAHNWRHHYRRLLRPTRAVRIGQQTIYLVDTCSDPASTAAV